MKRDFSEESKQTLLALVKEVESGQTSNFTDWIGDGWYNFQESIELLSVRHSINNVNSYHRDIIDKNNNTIQNVNRIFNNVNQINNQYKQYFEVCNENLVRIIKAIEYITNTIVPGGTAFHTNYINGSLLKMVNELTVLKITGVENTAEEVGTVEIEMNKDEIIEVFGEGLLSTSTTALKEHQCVSMLCDGIYYTCERKGNKYILKLKGPGIDNLVHKKWDGIETLLQKHLKDADWKKQDIKKIVNRGVDIEKLEATKYEALNDRRKILINNIHDVDINKSNVKLACGNMKTTFKENFKIFDDFVDYKKASTLKKAGKVLDAFGVILDVGSNAYEHLWQETSYEKLNVNKRERNE